MQLTPSLFALLALATMQALAQDAAPDPYLWLEKDGGPRVEQWIKAENKKTEAVLQKDPRFGKLERDARSILQAKDRIPTPELIGGQVYNFWQDAAHVRGIWRRTSMASYRSATPSWTTVLDLDELARTEHANWVWLSVQCDEPRETRCLIELSDGGEDASTIREFDVAAARFVADGFRLPHGKQSATWIDTDTLLVAREWQPGEVTSSGYPYVVKRLRRGEALSDAQEIFRGQTGDVGATPQIVQDGQGNQAVLVRREVSFFEAETWLVTPEGLKKLALPAKAQVQALFDDQLVISLDEPWAVAGTTFAPGVLVAVDRKAAAAHPDDLRPELIYAPGPRESLGSIAATHGALLVTTLDDVKGRAWLYRRMANGSWTQHSLQLPDNASIEPVDAELHGSQAFILATSFLESPTLFLVDALDNSTLAVKRLPARFDAGGDVVEQMEATAPDGTKIPYFIVHPTHMPLDGSNPTVLNAYGGFQVSETPFYSGVIGKLWLERGGVFVLANIRGGGEFGPAWHEAGLKTHRQVIYDDFASVAADLIARGITDPKHLGIMGGSNGGLLMGVEFIQHPELWRAVDIQVPLLDMMRYEKIAAGSSWVGEYGSVANPDEEAFLRSISPYANLKRGVQYPESFVWTTSKDDRVGPQHARKFAARLAEYGIPYLFYEETEGGHGSGGANLKEAARTDAMEWIYFIRALTKPKG